MDLLYFSPNPNSWLEEYVRWAPYSFAPPCAYLSQCSLACPTSSASLFAAAAGCPMRLALASSCLSPHFFCPVSVGAPTSAPSQVS